MSLPDFGITRSVSSKTLAPLPHIHALSYMYTHFFERLMLICPGIVAMVTSLPPPPQQRERGWQRWTNKTLKKMCPEGAYAHTPAHIINTHSTSHVCNTLTLNINNVLLGSLLICFTFITISKSNPHKQRCSSSSIVFLLKSSVCFPCHCLFSCILWTSDKEGDIGTVGGRERRVLSTGNK